ncbi:hypothetical protein QO014_002442 [Kaistia dalseonensis]|uniref:Uncharacterized protein n=1 Tax=Kaistia dalseonensis TaxID=410840 RepID=A0ABU0H6W4_9HYPH|nr:hypothetical protein [Kaistia dalseonensis]
MAERCTARPFLPNAGRSAIRDPTICNDSSWGAGKAAKNAETDGYQGAGALDH